MTESTLDWRVKLTAEHKDALRLLYLNHLMDGIGNIDFHERASEIAGGEAGDVEYLQAIREAIDAALKEDWGIA